MRRVLLILGLATLATVWLGPLPQLAPHFFSAHMTMHMGVVAVAAPLLGIALAGGRFDPSRRYPAIFSAIPASVVELVVVWSWHAPALHQAARGSTSGLVAEQATFLVSALIVWIAAFGGDPRSNGERTGTGVVALLLTSMHMTLLGALIGLAPRALYAHATLPGSRAPLDEQHLGGAIMLLLGGIVYLAGGLWLAARLVSDRPASAAPERAA